MLIKAVVNFLTQRSERQVGGCLNNKNGVLIRSVLNIVFICLKYKNEISRAKNIFVGNGPNWDVFV